MYDYWLGGKDNFEADRKAAQAVRALRPNVAEQAFDNKKFQTRVVTYVAGQRAAHLLPGGRPGAEDPALRPGDRDIVHAGLTAPHE